MTILLLILAAIMVIAGLAGTVLPALPGPVLVFFGLAVAAWAESFAYVGWTQLLILGLLTALTYVIDLAASALGTKKVGASPQAFWGATIGAIIGIFFGLPGLLLGPFLGAVVGELSVRRDLLFAGKVGVAAWIGMVVGAAVKLMIVFLIIGWFLAVRLL